MDDLAELFKAFEDDGTSSTDRARAKLKSPPSAALSDQAEKVRSLPSMWTALDEPPIPAPGSAAELREPIEDRDDHAEDVFDLVDVQSAPDLSGLPVGWLVVIEGLGRGTCFTLEDGVSTIGRDSAETISLDFDDAGLSPDDHASIAYDSDTQAFYFGHSIKTAIVRLNGKPVLCTEILESGGIIGIANVRLRFVALCDQSFNWSVESGG